MTTTARGRGAAGAVIDGYHRDTARLLTHDWPIFSRGAYAQDAFVRSVVTSFRAEIDVAGVQVRPGDMVVGDLDGVLIIPSAIEAEVIENAVEKMRAEDVVRESIANGMSARQAFAKYGVL
jgi:regulator of RNase E activity RraA